MGHLDPDPQWGHLVSVLKGGHVWYQIEGLEEIWQIFVEPACGERDMVVTNSFSVYACMCCACVRPSFSGP